MIKSQRSYKLTVAGNSGSVVIQPPFTLEFEIKRTNLQNTNNARIRIYNLNETTRKKIAKDEGRLDLYRAFRLDAGYGTNLPTIFKGNVNHAWSVREGVNYVTTIEAFDGGFGIYQGKSSRSFAQGTPINIILSGIAGDMPQVTVGAIGKGYDNTLKRGAPFEGSSINILRELTKEQSKLSIDLEKLYILQDDECIRGTLEVLDFSTGLLNTPIRSLQMLTFDVLFEPRINTHQIIQLKSVTDPSFNGLYKVVSVAHRGTISGTVSGDAVTSLGCWQGPKGLEVVA